VDFNMRPAGDGNPHAAFSDAVNDVDKQNDLGIL
jgi:hypothetical protein